MFRIDLETSKIEELPTELGGTPKGIAVDARMEELYWGWEDTLQLMPDNLNTGRNILIDHSRIYRGDLGCRHAETVFKSGKRRVYVPVQGGTGRQGSTPTEIALDVQSNTMYWRLFHPSTEQDPVNNVDFVGGQASGHPLPECWSGALYPLANV